MLLIILVIILLILIYICAGKSGISSFLSAGKFIAKIAKFIGELIRELIVDIFEEYSILIVSFLTMIPITIGLCILDDKYSFGILFIPITIVCFAIVITVACLVIKWLDNRNK